MSDEEGSFWDGETWVYHADVVNDGANSGNHTYTITVAAGSEMEVLYGLVANGDTSNRACLGNITDGTNRITRFIANMTLTAAKELGFPIHGDDTADEASTAGRLLISGGMTLAVVIASIAVSQDSIFGIACRIRGAKPTVVITSPTSAVETVNTDEVR